MSTDAPTHLLTKRDGGVWVEDVNLNALGHCSGHSNLCLFQGLHHRGGCSSEQRFCECANKYSLRSQSELELEYIAVIRRTWMWL